MSAVGRGGRTPRCDIPRLGLVTSRPRGFSLAVAFCSFLIVALPGLSAPPEPTVRSVEVTRRQVAAIEARLRDPVAKEHRQRATDHPPQFLSRMDRRILDVAQPEEEDCDEEGFATKTGDALVEHIRSATYPCVSRLFSRASGRVRFAAFRAQNMIDVAKALQPLASAYDGTNASNVSEVFLFLRAGYYVAFNEADDLDWYGVADEIREAVVSALDAFVESDHFYDETEEHGETLVDAVKLMDGADQQARYLPVAKDWLDLWEPSHADLLLDRAVNAVFVMFWRGHRRQDFVDATAADVALMEMLRDFALADGMADSVVEYLAANAGRELARFAQYGEASVYPTVEAGIRSILDRYDPYGEGQSIWVATAATAVANDDCERYEICGFEEEMEARLLAIRHSCGETIVIRTQDLTEEQLGAACSLLTNQEAYFHGRLRTDQRPVRDDFNSILEVVVFADDAQYQTFSGLFFGNSTNNGGIYLEGDPGDPDNAPRFIAYVATWLVDEPIWNLAHEQIHYLDGRFNMHGAFGDYRVGTHDTVWWLEGLAEYISKGNGHATAIDIGRGGDRLFSDVVGVAYPDGTVPVYRWSYLAMRFMFERHRDAVDVMLDHFRNGRFDAYLQYLRIEIGTTYDEEWLGWLQDVSISDDETPELAELPSALTVEEASSVAYSLALATEPTADVIVEVEASGDLTLDKASLTFTTEDWDVVQTVTVSAAADDNTSLDNATLVHIARGGGYDNARALISVRVTDNAPVATFAQASVSVAEGGTAILTVTIEEVQVGPTTIGYALGVDEDPDTSDADDDDYASSVGEVTIEAGETEVHIEIAVLDDDDIEAPRETFAVMLDSSTFDVFARGVDTASVVIEEGVCDRTPAVRELLRGSRDCASITATDLTWVSFLLLAEELDGPLRAGDFSGLTWMALLELSNNALTTLPATIFDDLHRLRYLDLDGNSFSKVPGVLDGLAELRGLSLHSNGLSELDGDVFSGNRGIEVLKLGFNELTKLPPGLFSGLSRLGELRLSSNPGAPFTLTLEWSRAVVTSGGMSLVARVAEAAPFHMRARVAATDGVVSSDWVEVSAGEIYSEPITVTPSGPEDVLVSFESVSGVPDRLCGAHKGYDGHPCYTGMGTASGTPMTLPGDKDVPILNTPVVLIGGDVHRIDLAGLFLDGAVTLTYTADSSDPTLVSTSIEGTALSVLSHEDGGEGNVVVTIVASDGAGRSIERRIEVVVENLARTWAHGWRVALLGGSEEADDGSESTGRTAASGD